MKKNEISPKKESGLQPSDCEGLGQSLGSRMFCLLDRTAPSRGSLKDRWQVRLVVDGIKLTPFTIADSPLAAVEEAQARAADFVQGLQEMHNAVKLGPIKTISRSANTQDHL